MLCNVNVKEILCDIDEQFCRVNFNSIMQLVYYFREWFPFINENEVSIIIRGNNDWLK